MGWVGRERWTRFVALAGPVFLLPLVLVVAACGGGAPPTATPHRTPVPGVEQTAVETAFYRVELWTGPVLTMMTAFPVMSGTDQGQPVNRHLEVHIFDKSSGAKVTDIIPVVKITDLSTGASRELALSRETGGSQGISFVTACLVSRHREVEPHFGDNLHLRSGDYTLIVGIGDEAAVAEITV